MYGRAREGEARGDVILTGSSTHVEARLTCRQLEPTSPRGAIINWRTQRYGSAPMPPGTRSQLAMPLISFSCTL